jgi:hypothetical protein
MTETKKSPEQMQFCFDESVSSDAAPLSVHASNVVSVNFGRQRASTPSSSKVEISPQVEKSIIGQVLDRARRLNW